MQCAVSSIDAYQQQHQQLLARVAMKLEMTTSELAALESSSRAPPASPLPAAVNVNEVGRVCWLGALHGALQHVLRR